MAAARLAAQLEKLQQLRRRGAGAVDPSVLGNAIFDVADAYKAMGRYEEAVPYAKDTVTAFRTALAAAVQTSSSPHSPKAMAARSLLETSLSSLAYVYACQARHQEALVPAREALELCRDLTRVNMAEYKASLATACQQVSSIEACAGQHATALELGKEAVKLRRALAAAKPAEHAKSLAKSIKDLGVRQRDLHMNAEAAQSSREAAKMYLALAETDLEDNWEELAELSDTFVELQQRYGNYLSAEAQQLAEDVVRLRRVVVRARPKENTSRVAHALTALGSIYYGRKQYKRGIDAVEEAAVLLRARVAAGQPDMERSLAKALLNLYTFRTDASAAPFFSSASTSSAEAIIKECIDLGRRMQKHRDAAKYAEAASEVFAKASHYYRERADYDMAVQMARDALSTHRAAPGSAAADDDVTSYRVDFSTGQARVKNDLRVALIESLVGALMQQAGIGRSDDGKGSPDTIVPAMTEAIQYLRALTTVSPETHRPILVSCLNALASHYRERGQLDESLQLVHETLRLQQQPPVQPENLLVSLEQYCELLAKQGMYAEVVPSAQEAIRIVRTLVPNEIFDRQAIDARLTSLLVKLAEAQQSIGQNTAALEPATEAKAVLTAQLNAARQRVRRNGKHESGFLEQLVSANVILGRCHYNLGRGAKAIAAGEEAVRLAREVATKPSDDDDKELGRYLPDTMCQLAFWKLHLGAVDEAEALATEALGLAREYDRKAKPTSMASSAEVLPLSRLAEVHMQRGECVRAMAELRQLAERAVAAASSPASAADPLAPFRVNAFVQLMATHLHRLTPGAETTAATAAFVLARVPRLVAANPAMDFLAVAALAFASACATASGNANGAQQFAVAAVRVLVDGKQAERLVIDSRWW